MALKSKRLLVSMEQITKADRLRVSCPLHKWQSPRHATAA